MEWFGGGGRKFGDHKKLKESEIFVYNRRGKVINYKRTSPKKCVLEEKTYVYSQDGYLISFEKFRAEDCKKTSYVYTYDKCGKKIEFSEYEDGHLLGTEVCVYDKSGSKTQCKYYNEDRVLKLVVHFDCKGKKILEESYNENGCYEGKTTYQYDEERNVVIEKWFKEDCLVDHVDTYQYLYDCKGNWIKRLEDRNNIPKSVTEREITYYW